MVKDKNEDPSPLQFRKEFVLVAIVLVIIGIVVFIIASAFTGGIIALLGVIFGLGTRVAADAEL